jgi:hypothetical protein
MKKIFAAVFNVLIVGLLPSLFLGCASANSNQPRVIRDEFTGDERVVVQGGSANKLQFTYELFTTKTSSSTIQVAKIPILGVKYFGSDWLFIRDDESLELLVDGTRVAFNVFGPVDRQVVMAGVVVESATYLVAPEELEKIVSANEVKVRVTGEKGSLTIALTPQGISNGRRFYETYVKPDPIPASAIQQLRGR